MKKWIIGLACLGMLVGAAMGQSVVVNEFRNDSPDAIELVVVDDNLDMQGMLIKDYSSSGESDNGGAYIFSSNSLWASLPAGTIIVLRLDASEADVTVGGGDYNLDVGLQNTTYFTAGSGSLNIATEEIVQIKASGSDQAGSTGAIHTFGTAGVGAFYDSSPTPKLKASTGNSGFQESVEADNTTSALSDFNGTDATGDNATGTIGTFNNANNQTYIESLRGPAVFSVSFDLGDDFIVDEGVSEVLTATAVNGTEPYTYSWSSTLGATYYTVGSNVFTILATAPTGSFSATVEASDASPATVTNSINFSVVTPAPKYAITITTPTNGTVTTTPTAEAEEGETVTINATPDGGYAVDTITVIDASLNPVAVTGTTFTMPGEAVSVTVTFAVYEGGVLIISQYYEGAGYDKWIEIYNPGPGSVDLDADGYNLGRWGNANREGWKTSVAPDDTVALTGSLAEGATLLVRHASAVLPSYAVADITNSGACNFNGDDSVVMYTGATFAFANVVDAFGLTNTTTTPFANRSFVRTNSVTSGVNTDFNAADWIEYTNTEVNDALAGTNERLGYHSTGPVEFSVSFDQAEGFTVDEGSSQAVTATAANGTEPYTYAWSSTLGGTYYTAGSNLFTILATAPTGSFSATVIASDASPASVTNTINFSVVLPPVQYAITIITPTNGTVTTTPETEAVEGETVTINATGDVGYAVGAITVIDAGLNPVTVIGTTFTMPGAAVTVTVTFEEASTTGELIISQYYEGASLNKWIEIYNPGTIAVDLAGGNYRLGQFSNADRETWKTDATPTLTVVLSGSISGGGTYLISHGSAVLPDYVVANQTAGFGFNGDDSLILYTGETYAFTNVMDAFGVTNATTAEFENTSFVRTNTVTVGVDTDFNAADWEEYTNAEVDAAAVDTNERLGYHFTGPAVFGVTVDKSNGYVIDEGDASVVTATAANGTAPYSYDWTSSLDGTYYTTNDNVFTVLVTAPTGSYSTTVIATDSTNPVPQVATNILTFSVVTPGVSNSITITPPVYGTVTTTPEGGAYSGDTVTVNATPDGGFQVDSITVVDAATNPVAVVGTDFVMPASAVTVNVIFSFIPTGAEVIVVGSRTGDVDVQMDLTIYLTNSATPASDWGIVLKDPDNLDVWVYDPPPAFAFTPTKVGDYSLTVTALDDSPTPQPIASTNVTLTITTPSANPDIPPITFVAGTGFTFDIPAGYTLTRVEGAVTTLSGEAFNWLTLTEGAGNDYTLVGSTVTILDSATLPSGFGRMIRLVVTAD